MSITIDSKDVERELVRLVEGMPGLLDRMSERVAKKARNTVQKEYSNRWKASGRGQTEGPYLQAKRRMHKNPGQPLDEIKTVPGTFTGTTFDAISYRATRGGRAEVSLWRADADGTRVTSAGRHAGTYPHYDKLELGKKGAAGAIFAAIGGYQGYIKFKDMHYSFDFMYLTSSEANSALKDTDKMVQSYINNTVKYKPIRAASGMVGKDTSPLTEVDILRELEAAHSAGKGKDILEPIMKRLIAETKANISVGQALSNYLNPTGATSQSALDVSGLGVFKPN